MSAIVRWFRRGLGPVGEALPDLPRRDDVGVEQQRYTDEHRNDSDQKHVDRAERNRVIRKAVDCLPVKYREVLIVFYFHEMDVLGAAASLGLPEGTLKSRLSRARELLRRKLPAHVQPEGQ